MKDKASNQKYISVRSAHSTNIFSALLFIAIGTILLFNNFGLLPWSIWEIILRFWPILLIIAGFQVILGSNPIFSLLVSLVGAAAIGLILAISVASVNQDFNEWLKLRIPAFMQIGDRIIMNTGDIQREKITVSGENFPNIVRRIVQLEFGAGKYKVQDVASNNFLDMDAIYSGQSGKPKVNTTTIDHEIRINVDTKQHLDGVFTPINRMEYFINIGKTTIPTNININLGAGNLLSEYNNLIINKLKINVGAGNADVKITAQSLPKEAEFDIGAGRILLHIPRDSALRLNYAVGLGRLRIDNKDFHGEGVYTSTDYADNEKKAEFRVHVGAGEAMFIYE